MIKRAGDGVSLVVKICEAHFGDAFSNDVEKAGDSPLGESGPIWGNLSGTAEVKLSSHVFNETRAFFMSIFTC